MPEAPPAGRKPLEVPLAAPRPEALQREDVQPGIAAAKGLKAPVLPTPAGGGGARFDAHAGEGLV